MRTTSLVLAAAAALTVSAGVTAVAQKTTDLYPGKRKSPHVKTEYTVDGANISITYGRPYLKGRSEEQMMPPGKPWRTGADEATILTTDKPIQIGSLKLEAGSYTLNTEPGAQQWQLLVGKLGDKGEKQWGIPYQPDLEIGRVPMTVGKTDAPVEQVTIEIDDTDAGATLRLEWGTTRATVPFTVT